MAVPNVFDVLPAFVILPVAVTVALCPLTKFVQLPPFDVNALPLYVLLALFVVHVVALFPIEHDNVLLDVPSLNR